MVTRRDDPARVSVVVVSYRGADDTIACLDGLRQLDWPSGDLEVVVVENNSGDDSAARIAAAHPEAVLLELDENLGFAGGCNRGAAAANGEYVAFLNNDARPDPQWLRAAVAELRADGGIGCVASKVLDWQGQVVDFVDAAISFYGHGFKLHAGEPNQTLFDSPHDVLFASGAAMVMPKRLFESAGGFDERYFMFFEDVDLGWRLWMLGHRVRYVPTSLVYHRHHASMARYSRWWENYLCERNALFTIFKNYDDTNLPRMLAAAQALVVRRGVRLSGVDAHALDLAKGAAGNSEHTMPIDKVAAASLFAIDALVEAMPSLSETRADLQARRTRPDDELLRMFRLPLFPNIADPEFIESFDHVVEALGVGRVFGGRRRVLVLTGDVVAARMAGPAIRAWQMALALCREHDVWLVSTVGCSLGHPDFKTGVVEDVGMEVLEAWCDVIVFQGHVMSAYPALVGSKKVVVVDAYDPFHLEQLEQTRGLVEEERRESVLSSVRVLNQQFARGDFFLCASEKQRDFWLGQMAALGRVNPVTYDASPSLEGLIGLAPFGVSDELPVHSRRAVKGVVPGIGVDDELILWGGGIYNWFDPLTLIRAVDKLRVRRPRVRLFFLGVQHPNPNVLEMQMVGQARRLAEDLGLVGTFVFFNEEWVAYDDRQNYLLEADVGVSTHFDHIETAFSFRTRILDYLWASLPIVTTGGDSFADLIASAPLGVTVPAEDVDALEGALFRVLDDEGFRLVCRENAAGVADAMRWSRVLEPLVEFCRDPKRAPDLLAGLEFPTQQEPLPYRRPKRLVVHDVRRGVESVAGALGVGRVFGGRRRVLVLTGDVVAARMAGPAIRAWQMALALCREHDVWLVSTVGCSLGHPDFKTGVVEDVGMEVLEAWCDVIVFQGHVMSAYPALVGSKKVVVVDAYDPFHLEQLEQTRGLVEEERRESVLSSVRVLNQQFARGDFFLCASEKQRDFWLGQMAALGRVNPVTYDASPSLEGLIGLAPFGVSDELPVHSRRAVKGVVPGIGVDDELILWGGGIYNWFDPLTLIRAVDKLRVRRPRVRLFFLGVQHPNPNVLEMQMVGQARRLAEDLGLVGTFVFFNEEWVAYDDRQNYLLEADVGVSTHFDHIETAFSFRTRILDYLWASLPIVTTGGDSFADLIASAPLGVTVPAEDVDALEGALFRVLDDEGFRLVCRENAAGVADAMRWSRVLEPLVEFCRDPKRAPDLLARIAMPGIDAPRRTWRERGGLSQDLRIVKTLVSEGGAGLVAAKAAGRLRRLTGSSGPSD